jgi:hypothetical protein
MALSYPTIVPTKYQGTATDFNMVKCDRQGVVRTQYSTVTIPASTATSTVVGIVPFTTGARVIVGACQVQIADLDTSTNVTCTVGYTYEDSANTSVADAFALSNTKPQSGGIITLDSTTGIDFVAVGNGWVTLTTGGGTTTTAGAIKAQIALEYDGLVAVN